MPGRAEADSGERTREENEPERGEARGGADGVDAVVAARGAKNDRRDARLRDPGRAEGHLLVPDHSGRAREKQNEPRHPEPPPETPTTPSATPHESPFMTRRITSASKGLTCIPASTTSPEALTPLAAGLRRKTAARATSSVVGFLPRSVSRSA